MEIFQKEIPIEIMLQICKIQNELLFEVSDLNSIKTLVENGALFFVETKDPRKVICFCSIKPSFDEWEIYDIATIREFQNQGFAKKIIVEVLDFAEKNSVKKIFLEVRESNLKAINLYLKFGFEQYNIRKNYYPDKENAVCMTRKF